MYLQQKLPSSSGEMHYNEMESRNLQWFISTVPSKLAHQVDKLKAATLSLHRTLLLNPWWQSGTSIEEIRQRRVKGITSRQELKISAFSVVRRKMPEILHVLQTHHSWIPGDIKPNLVQLLEFCPLRKTYFL